jgi:hypothetical protein
MPSPSASPPWTFVRTDWDFRSISPRRSSSRESCMNLAVSFVGAALAYLFIFGLVLVWNRGANRSSTPKPGPTSKDRSSSPIDSPRRADHHPWTTRRQGRASAEKAGEVINGLQKLVDSGTLSPADTATAKALIEDLRSALSTSSWMR